MSGVRTRPGMPCHTTPIGGLELTQHLLVLNYIQPSQLFAGANSHCYFAPLSLCNTIILSLSAVLARPISILFSCARANNKSLSTILISLPCLPPLSSPIQRALMELAPSPKSLPETAAKLRVNTTLLR